MSNSTLVQVDARKRVSLGTMAHHDQYLVREEEGGVIIFEPAVVLTASERAFLSDSDLSSALERINANPEKRRTRDRKVA